MRRITQSFADNELSALNPSDWQKANDLGCALAEKLYPAYQSAVYTHIDGEHHILHNHIIVSKVKKARVVLPTPPFIAENVIISISVPPHTC
ncbi:relaxase/mobilization nuclease domain-containing protein [Levilactobacillus brevis]